MPENQEDQKDDQKNDATEKGKQADQKSAELTEDQWKLAFNHPRFKELTTAAEELKALKVKQTEDEEKKLAESKKWEELAEKRRVEKDELLKSYDQTRKDSAFQVEALKRGITDTDAALKLADLSKVSISKDGQIEGVKEALDALITQRPFLVNTQKKDLGTGINPNNGQFQGATYTNEQLKDHKFYMEHEADIKKALAEGRITD